MGRNLYFQTITARRFCFVLSLYSGENTSLLECMKILNKKGIQTALVTANLQSPLVVYSQHQIIIPDYEKQNKIATFYSQLAFMYILNNLHALIYHLKNK